MRALCPNACWRPLLLWFFRVSTPARSLDRTSNIEWRTFTVQDFGTAVQYPANIFFPAGERGTGQRFKSADGRADLSIYSLPNGAGETPATYLRQHPMDCSALQYTRIARSFFAISSGARGGNLIQCRNFSKRGRAAIHCFDLVYPQQEKRSWGHAVVIIVSLSSRPLEG